jgi:hypothetical protein
VTPHVLQLYWISIFVHIHAWCVKLKWSLLLPHLWQVGLNAAGK